MNIFNFKRSGAVFTLMTAFLLGSFSFTSAMDPKEKTIYSDCYKMSSLREVLSENCSEREAVQRLFCIDLNALYLFLRRADTSDVSLFMTLFKYVGSSAKLLDKKGCGYLLGEELPKCNWLKKAKILSCSTSYTSSATEYKIEVEKDKDTIADICVELLGKLNQEIKEGSNRQLLDEITSWPQFTCKINGPSEETVLQEWEGM